MATVTFFGAVHEGVPAFEYEQNSCALLNFINFAFDSTSCNLDAVISTSLS